MIRLKRFAAMAAWLGSLLTALAMAGAQASPVAAPSRDKPRILVVMTNHERYPSRSDTTGLWLTELTEFIDVVEAAGYDTVFVSPQGGRVPLDERSLGWLNMNASARKHLEDAGFRRRLAQTLPIDSVDPAQYRAIYFTGGHGVMWDFPDNPAVQRVAAAIHARGGVLAAVCHGVAGLVDVKDAQGMPLIRGRQITGFSNREEWLSGMRDQVPFLLEDRLLRQGARYSQGWIPFTSHVVIDGRLVTGQNPQSPKAVAEALLSVLNSKLP